MDKNKKGLFTGWKDVFRFTIHQASDGKGFRLATFGITLLCFAAMVIVSVVMAMGQEKKDNDKQEDQAKCAIDNVFVMNEAKLEGLDFSGFAAFAGETFEKVSFKISGESQEALLKNIEASTTNDVIMKIDKSTEGYGIEMVLPNRLLDLEDDANSIAESTVSIVQQAKFVATGISNDKIMLALSPVITDYEEAGSKTDVGAKILKIVLPMAMVFLVYMMVLLYGQSIAKIVSAEKTSKLMEMLLISVRPYALILGKVLAMASIAIFQFLMWMAGIISGLFVGHYVATNINPDFSNIIFETIDMLKNSQAGSAFSWVAIVLSVVTVCIGFLFYCVLAGMVASTINKAEELAQGMAIYQMAVIFSFLGGYMLPLQNNEVINTVLRILPFTSTFVLGGDILVGNISAVQGVLYLLLLVISTLLAIVATGKVYRNRVFYQGASKKAMMRFFRSR